MKPTEAVRKIQYNKKVARKFITFQGLRWVPQPTTTSKFDVGAWVLVAINPNEAHTITVMMQGRVFENWVLENRPIYKVKVTWDEPCGGPTTFQTTSHSLSSLMDAVAQVGADLASRHIKKFTSEVSW